MDLVKRIYNNKKRYSIFVFAIILASFLFGGFVFAADWDAHILDAFSILVYVVVAFFGKLIGVILGVFKEIVVYNEFAGAGLSESHPVAIGWSIIRDICNMFFVVVLLIISIGSILQIETYNYRKWLPRLVIMAVLINFSMMFSGMIIDVSQIVMLTLAAGIIKLGEGNIFDMLGINHFLSMNYSQLQVAAKVGDILEGGEKEDLNAMNLAITIILALVTSFIALVVISAMAIIIGIRIVALWFLVILSPVAYLFSASPVGTKYASEWWQKFSQWVIVGPAMMFFIWLSLFSFRATMQGMMAGGSDSARVGVAVIGSIPAMVAFLMASIMLMGSLVAAQSIGGLAAKVAGSAFNKVTKTGTWAGRKFSGVNYVTDRVKGYQKLRESKKQERITRDVGYMHGMVGELKQGTVGAVGKGLGGALQGVRRWGKDKTADLSTKADKKEEESRLSDEELEDKYEKEQFERGNRQVRQLREKQRNADPAMRQIIEDKIEKIENKQLKGFNADDERDRLKSDAAMLRTKAAGGKIAGGVGTVAAFLPEKVFKKMADAGKDNIDYAQNYKHQEIMRHASEMRGDEEEDLRRKADDQTLTWGERGGARMALLERGDYDGDEMVGVRKKLEGLGSKKTLSVADGYIAKKRPDLVMSDDAKKDQKIEKKVKAGLNPSDLDSKFFSDRNGKNAAIFAKHATKSQLELLSKSQKAEFRKGIKKRIDNISDAQIDGVEKVFDDGYRKEMEAFVKHKGDAGDAYQFAGGSFKDKRDDSGNVVVSADVARRSLLKTIKKGNAVDVIGGIKASEITGDVSRTIIDGFEGEDGLTPAQLRTMAQNAASSNDGDRIKTVEKIISEVKSHGKGRLHDSLKGENKGLLKDFGAGWGSSGSGLSGTPSGPGLSGTPSGSDYDDYSPDLPRPSVGVRRRIAEDAYDDYSSDSPKPRIPKVDYISDEDAKKFEEESLSRRKADNYSPDLPKPKNKKTK